MSCPSALSAVGYKKKQIMKLWVTSYLVQLSLYLIRRVSRLLSDIYICISWMAKSYFGSYTWRAKPVFLATRGWQIGAPADNSRDEKRSWRRRVPLASSWTRAMIKVEASPTRGCTFFGGPNVSE